MNIPLLDNYNTSKDRLLLEAKKRQSDHRLAIGVFVTALVLTPLLVLVGITSGVVILLASLVVIICVALIMRWPILSLYFVLACVVLIEQQPLDYPILTDRLTIYYWPPSLAGLIERPIGFLILFAFLVIICYRLLKRQSGLRGGGLIWPFAFLLCCVVMGIVHGLTSGGNFKIIVLEIRPFWYMFLAYLLAYNLIKHKDHLRAFFWVTIIGAGIKGLQGTYIYLVLLQGHLTDERQMMAHEESFFFVAFLLLIALFYLHHRYRPQLRTALWLTPVVLIALVANQRRTDYLALLLGLAVSWSLVFCIKPKARKGLIIGMLVCLLLGTTYVLAFSHSSGALGSPARGILSVIDPTTANASDSISNMYRQIENYDLTYTVKQNQLLGLGFGKPFPQPLPLIDLSTGDPALGGNPFQFIPHNTVYWIWMRMGPLGYSALWFLIGSVVVRGCLTARQLKDPFLQLFAIYVVATTIMEVLVAYGDYQLFFYRNVLYMGLLFGILMKLPSLDTQSNEVHA